MIKWFSKKFRNKTNYDSLLPQNDYNVVRFLRLYSTLEEEEKIRKSLNKLLKEYLYLCASKQLIFRRNKRKVILNWCGKSEVSLVVWILRVYLDIEATQAYTIMKTEPQTVPHLFFPANINSGSSLEYWAKWELILTWKFSNKHILYFISHYLDDQIDNLRSPSFGITTSHHYLEWISLRRDVDSGDVFISVGGEKIKAHGFILEQKQKEFSSGFQKFAVEACLEYLYLGYISDWNRFGKDEKEEILKVAEKWELNHIIYLCLH